MSWRTNTAVAVDFIHAGRTFGTRRRLTLVYVDAAVGSGESWGTLAAKPVHTVDADASVVARMGIAVIDILCTGESLPAVLADAGEGVSPSDTRPSVLTRTRVTCAVLGCVAGAATPA